VPSFMVQRCIFTNIIPYPRELLDYYHVSNLLFNLIVSTSTFAFQQRFMHKVMNRDVNIIQFLYWNQLNFHFLVDIIDFKYYKHKILWPCYAVSIVILISQDQTIISIIHFKSSKIELDFETLEQKKGVCVKMLHQLD